jgi:acyl-CoA reductase-like NAD-dependent aldehyde dehydrogenase
MKTRNDEERELISLSLAEARAAQGPWARQPICERLRFVRRLRPLIAEHAIELAVVAAAANQRPAAEKLASEVLPLADACRWLDRYAGRVLESRRCEGEGQPFWLRGVSFEVQRQPFGIVLVIGPANYPLFIPAVQTLHALIAGNAVLLKPAPGTHRIASLFARLARLAGLDRQLLTVLPVDVEAASAAIAQGVDKVIFTGSFKNGKDVLGQLAPLITPAVMELSGEDAMLVLEDADLDLVVSALGFGTRWNNGDTCIAPRRLLVLESVADDLQARLSRAALPALSFERVADETAAVQGAMASKFALGVSIFTRNVPRALALAAQIKSGFVLINDLIVPTVDPRMPFGGVKASGLGITRGNEGLLEMTYPHVVAVRRGRLRPHFEKLESGAERLFSAYILTVHGPGQRRLGALLSLLGALIEEVKRRKAHR